MEATRRKAVIVGGTLLSGSLFGLSQAQDTKAQAEIALEELTVPDTEESIKSVESVPINLTIRSKWDSTGADTLEADLFAGLSETTATNLTTETYEIAESGDQTFEISGDVLKSADIGKDMVDPSIGASLTISIGLQTTLKAGGETLDSSELWDTAELSVNDDVIEGELTTGANGELTVQ